MNDFQTTEKYKDRSIRETEADISKDIAQIQKEVHRNSQKEK